MLKHQTITLENRRAEVISSVVEHLPNMHQALGLIPNSEKKKKKFKIISLNYHDTHIKQ
jgi:hypothetical protein